VDLVDDLPARTQRNTGQPASQLLAELANIIAARARRAGSAARELNRPPPTPSTGWTRDLTTQAAALDLAAAHQTVAADQARPGAPTTRPSTTRPPPTSTSINSPPTGPSCTPPPAPSTTRWPAKTSPKRAAIAAVDNLPARRPAPVAPSGRAGPRPGPTRSAQLTSRPPSR